MSATHTRGFTIIETMLFLAVSGVLIVAILAGTGSSINIQRYRDSVSTLKAMLEQQYAEVSTVRNEDRSVPIVCDTNAVIGSTGVTLPRGQSDCVVLGRYLTIVDRNVTVSSVVGYKSATLTPYKSDIKELQDYKLSLLPTTTEQSTLEWGARIAWPVSGGGAKTPTMPRQIAILVLQSPSSGLTYTFSGDDAADSLHNLIIAGNHIPGQSQRRICVDSDGGFGGGLAVLIGAYASGVNALQVRSNDMGDSSVC